MAAATMLGGIAKGRACVVSYLPMTVHRSVLAILVSIVGILPPQRALADIGCDATGTEMCSPGSPYCARTYSACRTIAGRTEVYPRGHQDQPLWSLPQTVSKAVVAT